VGKKEEKSESCDIAPKLGGEKKGENWGGLTSHLPLGKGNMIKKGAGMLWIGGGGTVKLGVFAIACFTRRGVGSDGKAALTAAPNE